jgi:hypothetical protein
MPGLDPRIALQSQAPQLRSPLQTLGTLAQLRNQQGLNEERQLASEQKRRDLAREDLIQQTVRRHGIGKEDAAIDELYSVDREAAGLLSKSVAAHRKAQSDEMTRLLDNRQKTATFVSQITKTMVDQGSHDMGRDAIGALPGGQEFLQYIPREFDPDVVKRVGKYGIATAEQSKAELDAVDNANKASELQLKVEANARAREENQLKARDYWQKSASIALANTGEQDDWDRRQRLLIQHGAPADVLAQFGNQWSKEAVAKAKALGMTPKESADVAHQKVEERQGQQRIALEGRRVAVDEATADTGGTGRRLTVNRQSQVAEWKARQYAALEKEMRQNQANLDPESVTLKLGPEARSELGWRKLQVEDASREMLGLPPLADAEAYHAGRPGSEKELRKLRNVYKQLTGQETPLEQMTKLAGQLKAERDPAKAAALRRQLAALRDQYLDQVGR